MQATHAWFVQIWPPPQSALLLQFPEMQEPPEQTWLLPYASVQSLSTEQVPQWKLLQTWAVLLQSCAVRQVPGVQAPAWQR